MAAASLTTIALVATACGGGGSTPDPATDASQGGGGAGGAISINGCTPKAPLIAGNTSETCGGNIVDAFTAKLVPEYAPYAEYDQLMRRDEWYGRE